MAGFKDATGRAWELKLDAPLVKRIKSMCGITLTDLKADPFLELAIDPVKLVDVLYLCVERQAIDAGVSDVQFGEGLGESIAEATAALEAAVVDFFPATMRSSLQSLLSKSRSMQEKTLASTMQKLTESQSEIEEALANAATRRIRDTLAEIGGDSSD